jgi:hypothetical protein
MPSPFPIAGLGGRAIEVLRAIDQALKAGVPPADIRDHVSTLRDEIDSILAATEQSS